MKKTFGKRIVSLLLAAILFAGMIPALPASAVLYELEEKYCWPVDGCVMSQGYYPAGNSFGHNTHYGIDITSDWGKEIKAVYDGTVICASTASADPNWVCSDCNRGGAGYHVSIRHPDGKISYYAHMSSVDVTKGSQVKKGQRIGGMGSTGYSTGTHLHFSIFNGYFSDSVLQDPLAYISPFSSIYVTDVSETRAIIHANFGAEATMMIQAGFFIGTDPNNLKQIVETFSAEESDGVNANGSYIGQIFYDTAKWYGQLKPDTTYYYRVFLSSYDNTYVSQIRSFRTGGTHTHDFSGEWEIKTPASCQSTGVKVKKCLGCDETMTETIPAGGHSWGEWKVTKPATATATGLSTRTCNNCGATENKTIEKLPASITDAKAVLQSVTGRPGEEVKVAVRLENADDVRSIAVFDLEYDSSRLTLVGGEWLLSDAPLKDWDKQHHVGAAALKDAGDVSGDVLILTFKIKEGTPDATVSVDCRINLGILKDGKEDVAEIPVTAGSVQIVNVIRGDVNGDDAVDSADAIYLLYYTLLGESRYPLNQQADFDGDGSVSSADAIYLLYHSLLGADRYPLN